MMTPTFDSIINFWICLTTSITMLREEENGWDEMERLQVTEEFATMMESIPCLHNPLIFRILEWPSLTVEWLPQRTQPTGNNISIQKIVLGTYTDDEPNYLMLAEVHLPLDNSEHDGLHNQENGGSESFGDANGKYVLCCSILDGFGTWNVSHFLCELCILYTARVLCQVQISQQISHDGEVNRARHMPHNAFLIATKAVNAEVYVFDSSKHPCKPPQEGRCNPDLRLHGHKEEGFGLSWSSLKEGHLLSGSLDKLICLWDVCANPKDQSIVDAMQIYEGHTKAVEDVAWHLRHEHLFGSVGGDCKLLIWDTREHAEAPVDSAIAHADEVNCLSFNPFDEWVLATGSSDGTVVVHDLRRLGNPMHTLSKLMKEVTQVRWSPHNETILASCGADRSILIWDISKAGNVQSPQDAEGIPPELLFRHVGHADIVSDFSWNPADERVIASVAQNNVVEIWKMAEYSYHNEFGSLPSAD